MAEEIHIPSAAYTPTSEVDGISPEVTLIRHDNTSSDINLTLGGAPPSGSPSVSTPVDNIFTKKHESDHKHFIPQQPSPASTAARPDNNTSVVSSDSVTRQPSQTFVVSETSTIGLSKDDTLESIKRARANRGEPDDKEPENENQFIPDIHMNLLAVEVASIDSRMGLLRSVQATPVSRSILATPNSTSTFEDERSSPQQPQQQQQQELRRVSDNKSVLSEENLAKLEKETMSEKQRKSNNNNTTGVRFGSTTVTEIPEENEDYDTSPTVDGTSSVFSTAVDEEMLAKNEETSSRRNTLFLPENWSQLKKPTLTMDAVLTSKAKEQKSVTPSFIKTKGTLESQLLVGLRVYEELTFNKAAKLYQNAVEFMNEGDFERALMPLNKAINLKSEEPQFYACRGECLLQLTDFQSAILNYKKAHSLQPSDQQLYSKLAFIYFFQGQTLFDQKLYSEALESFTKAAEMKPEIRGYHTRSIACLTALHRHGECLALINKRLEQERDNADLFVMRARLHDLFQNSTLCSYDVKDALLLDAEHPEALTLLKKMQDKAKESKQQAISLNLIGKHQEALQKITTAIETDPSCPEYHVFRGALYRRTSDFNSAIDDYLLALDKTDHNEDSPIYMDAQRQLLLTYNDFAVECFSKGFYEEAVVLLNKAIKGEKREKGLYINRGDCFYRQGDLHFSLADYHQALEIDPYDTSIRSRISVIHNEFGVMEYQDRNFEEAESRFTLAIQNNPKIGHYYVSRCRARYVLENHNAAREDILYALLLDSQNEEIMSVLSRLFPGKSVRDIITSQAADTARIGLQNAVVTASPVRLPPMTDDTLSITTKPDYDDDSVMISSSRLRTCEQTLSIPPTAPQSLSPPHAAGKPLIITCVPDIKQCMEERDFHIKIAKEKKKINNAVKSALNNRKTLRRDKNHRVVRLPGPVSSYRHGGTPDIQKSKVPLPAPTGWRKFTGGINA
ncbi:uncharacterized protein LOC141909320 [Tubulanus polymorphus]|uniref:uncharacterized protein LOC141909320 n=1 Tax=Tubulanus polymorphus TaxID=672921 RepID=UPI003DA4554B